MDLVIWTYIFGGATVFALIVGIFSVYNGRMTRRELGAVIERGNERTHSLLERMDARLEHMDGRLEKLTEYMQDMDQRHSELLTRLAERIP